VSVLATLLVASNTTAGLPLLIPNDLLDAVSVKQVAAWNS
jgi:hypothetical protein